MKRVCEFCKKDYDAKVYQTGEKRGLLKRPEQRFCSRNCQNGWQQTISWEDRIGLNRANEIRSERSVQVTGDNNPSKNPLVAKKISESMKLHLSENPRCAEKNPFYGKKHTIEYKEWASESRKGKWSYDVDGYKRQNENTPKQHNHPNWQGGLSYGDYDYGFDNEKRRLVKNRDNQICQICGDSESLHIHHIDYDKNNSDERNLITLCNSCHSKTNWKRESWIQFFKPIMEQKYIKNKFA